MQLVNKLCKHIIAKRVLAPFLRDKVIYCTDGQGIGNRLKYMVSFLYLLKPQRFLLVWPSSGWVSKKFSELFSFQWPYSFYEFSNFYCYHNERFVSSHWLNRETWRLYADERDVPPGPVRGYKASINGCSIDFAFENIPDSVKNRYVPLFNLFVPSYEVQKRMTSVVLPENAIALQIRNEKKWGERGRNEALDGFITAMRQSPRDTKFYLSAITPSVSIAIKEVFDDRILELPNKNYKSMVDATADLFLLSKAKSAIYSFGSTFSETAWWLGGASQKVRLVGSPEHWS